MSRPGALGLTLLLALGGCGSDRTAGEIEGERRPDAALRAAERGQDAARAEVDASAGAPRASDDKRILFGDLHVHTTYSGDAFLMSLPLLAGEGARPPADACDFARYCAALDFFSLNDHAEALTQKHWRDTIESLRQCNALAGDPDDPDLVAFVGWEWTQVGATPEAHYGHKNVMFPGLADDELPARPINSLPDQGMGLFAGLDLARGIQFIDPGGWSEYADFFWLIDQLADAPTCPKGVDTRELPLDCRENATTPAELFEKLDQWGFETLVIPHGTTWGLYTPPGTRMDKQLSAEQHDPQRQKLIEVFSGHGNSEEYRPWREAVFDEDGNPVCPEPTPDFLPCCWRAGEIMRSRCGDLPEAECEARVEEARRLAMAAGAAPRLTFVDAEAEEWLDCDQCRDCFKPSLSLRPRESVQYSMALSNFDAPQANGAPLRFRYGFISSSDNHTARPGTGYKQYARREMTEAKGPRSAFYASVARRRTVGTQEDPQRPQARRPGDLGIARGLDVERVASFLYPGGLVAVHADARSRASIWNALETRAVYGTSGPRILLWFDLLNAPFGSAPMGSEVALAETPRFEVRAVGSFVQKPGCPDYATRGLAPERLASLCRGECYNPSDERHPIVAIEVVRIRPQSSAGESVDALIEDPWLRLECEPDPSGCVVRFEDPDYVASGRDALYYVRALQEPTPAVNGANLRAEFAADGAVRKTSPCYGDYRTDFDDDCLAPLQERAWSSPIFVDRPRRRANRAP
ncbi:MAG: DUF3604 domain-containing protein [Myxococcota bacterium]